MLEPPNQNMVNITDPYDQIRQMLLTSGFRPYFAAAELANNLPQRADNAV
jgi:hypothetical protein